MKTLYFASFLISLLFLFLGVPPVPSELSVTDRLALHTEQWGIVFYDSDQKVLHRMTEAEAKSAVLAMLEHNRSTRLDPELLSIAIISLVFSFVGWRREVFLSHRKA